MIFITNEKSYEIQSITNINTNVHIYIFTSHVFVENTTVKQSKKKKKFNLDIHHTYEFVRTSQGEKRLEEIHRLTSATAKLISMFEDPWEELTFRNVGNQVRVP